MPLGWPARKGKFPFKELETANEYHDIVIESRAHRSIYHDFIAWVCRSNPEYQCVLPNKPNEVVYRRARQNHAICQSRSLLFCTCDCSCGQCPTHYPSYQ